MKIVIDMTQTTYNAICNGNFKDWIPQWLVNIIENGEPIEAESEVNHGKDNSL